MQVIFVTRCFTTIVPRFTNSQNKVALTIMGRGSKASALRAGAKKNEQEKNSQGSWGREWGRGVGRYSISFPPCSSVRATRHYIPTECASKRLKQAKPVKTTVSFSSWTALSIPPK